MTTDIAIKNIADIKISERGSLFVIPIATVAPAYAPAAVIAPSTTPETIGCGGLEDTIDSQRDCVDLSIPVL